MRVGIVGAGISGLSCADHLATDGIESFLFDKGRRPGGRLSTRISGDWAWDFGAQYFTVSNPDFAAWLRPHERAGRVSRWRSGPSGAYVGVPQMASLVEHAAKAHAVRYSAHVQRCERDGSGWWAHASDGVYGPFDALVLAIPAEQAVVHLAMHDLGMAHEAICARSAPCWTAMLGFAEPIVALPDFVRANETIAWAARNNSKPGRAAGEAWVVQADPGWSRMHLEAAPAWVAQQLAQGFSDLAGFALPQLEIASAHRWRFAVTTGGHGHPLWNEALQIGACGDWCQGHRIEDAWLSGRALAQIVKRSIEREKRRPGSRPSAIAGTDARSKGTLAEVHVIEPVVRRRQ